jgi:uncharacterized protein with ParB-like and HNH nuclease domain
MKPAEIHMQPSIDWGKFPLGGIMAKIEDHKYTIEEAFRECFYIVPDYQREYVWTEKEVQQLLQDVDEQFDTGERREYFIGTILVSPTGQKNHFEVN